MDGATTLRTGPAALLVAASAMLIGILTACGGSSSGALRAASPASHAPASPSQTPSATPLPTFAGNVNLNVSDDFAAPIPVDWDNATGDAAFAAKNGVPPSAKTELLLAGPGGGNGVTVPVFIAIQMPDDEAVSPSQFQHVLMANPGGFSEYLIRSSAPLTIDGAGAYSVVVSGTNPDGRTFEEWEALANHTGMDGNEHTYEFVFVSSPEAFASLLPTAQKVVGGLTWSR